MQNNTPTAEIFRIIVAGTLALDIITGFYFTEDY